MNSNLILRSLKLLCLVLFFDVSFVVSYAQVMPSITIVEQKAVFKPLEQVTAIATTNGTLSVTDSKGREYYKMPIAQKATFYVAGAVGNHTIKLLDKIGNVLSTTTFKVEVETKIGDGGRISELFDLLYKGMLVYEPDGVEEVICDGKTYKLFVTWVLDNANVMKGMQYFKTGGKGMVDLFKQYQQPNGMIWSFVRNGSDYHYYETAYSPINFFQLAKDAWFVRQPVENHVEYNFVNLMYNCWKSSGDHNWMKSNLDCASRALDYCVTDSIRWSKRFQLLKRPYCIDSWDFQVDDEYTPPAPISPTMVIVPGKTKFGIFFGDNTGYHEACIQLAEMYEFAGDKSKANQYRTRAKEILDRLNKLSWNGKFYTHFIDEDPTVKRNLGVDEKSQIAQGNAYSINRGLPHDQNVAIIKTYLDLKNNLPKGSPGEWYSIYPPFEKGFGSHNAKWQYMNGGIAGHAIGELARGAYENGWEDYASDIMLRLLDLGKKYGNRVWFSYTGAFFEPTDKPVLKTVNLAAQANMDLWDKGATGVFTWMNDKRSGNDMRNLPTGEQVFNDIKFNVINPETNGRKAVVAVSTRAGFQRQVEVPVNDNAATVYLLHSSSDNVPANVAGAISFVYVDGSEASSYIIKGQQVTNWWFSDLKNDYAGVAWWGTNLCSTKVGVCWAAITNPNPEKRIAKLIFHAPLEGGIYAIIGITLSDKPHYVRPKGESYGGPDNWAAALGMAALVEGLTGVKDMETAYNKVKLSPRWTSMNSDSVNVTVCYSESKGYISYIFKNNIKLSELELTLTGSGNQMNCHVLLPKAITKVVSVSSNNQPVDFKISKIENSSYVDFDVSLPNVKTVKIKY